MIIFLCIVFGGMFAIVINAAYKNINEDMGANSESLKARTRVAVNYAEQYPYIYSRTYIGQTENEKGILALFDEKIGIITSKVESYATEKVPYREAIVGINNRINKLLGNGYVTGDESIIEIKENYFVSLGETVDVTPHCDQIKMISEFCEGQNIPFIYVQAPCKLDKYDESLLVEDVINANGDMLIEGIQTADVDYIDLRETIHINEMDLYDMFYETDHHWKAETGVWASKLVINEINMRYGIGLDETVFEEEFLSACYEERLLGSLGKKVTMEVASLEDFTILYPSGYTDLSIDVPAYEYAARGEFMDVVIDWMWLDNVDNIDYYNEYIYESYCYGNNALIQMENHLCDNDKRVLILSNSFGLVVTPYIALSAKYVDQIHPGFFNGSIKKYIEVTKPDVVIALYSPSSIAPITGDGDSSIFVFD